MAVNYSPSSLPTKATAETTEDTTATTTAKIMINKPPPSNKNIPDIDKYSPSDKYFQYFF